MVSCTLTSNEPVASFPAASVALQLTGVVAIGNVEPEAGVHVTVTEPSTKSVAVAAPYVTSAPCGLVASFPAASVALQLTVVSPSGNVEPEAGSHVTFTEPSTSSVADASNVTSAPFGPVASSTLLPGSINSGAVVS